MTNELLSLLSQVHDFIRECSIGEIPATSLDLRFNELALAIFNFQFRENQPYGRFCQHVGIAPEKVERWQQIPAIATAAFKEMDLTVLEPSERKAVFHSSGTTEQQPSRHFHNEQTLLLYESSLRTWFKRHFLSDAERMRFLFLTPRAREAPRSSLAHMFETVAKSLGTPETTFVGGLNEEGRWDIRPEIVLAQLADAAAPVAICGTAFLFVHLCDWFAANAKQLKLPAGSRVLETGGYKGRSREVQKSELYDLIAKSFGISTNHIISEYGMSELSSQAYDAVFGAGDDMRQFRFPPWARAVVVSPENGQMASEGQPGLLRVFDLANVASALAVQTEDLAVQRTNGFELLGRSARSEPRGCSLASR